MPSLLPKLLPQSTRQIECTVFILDAAQTMLSGHTGTHLSEFILGLRLNSEARDIRVCEAGGVLQLFHPADLRHGLVLLLLLLLRLRGRHLHFMLLVWRDAVKHKRKTEYGDDEVHTSFWVYAVLVQPEKNLVFFL